MQSSIPLLKTFSTGLMVLLLVVISCDSSDNLEEQLIGKWMMEKIIEAGIDVTAEHNPEGNRWIRFNEDGSFESGGDPYGDNSGRWEIDPAKSVLNIFSSEENDNSEWGFSIIDNEMTWTGIGLPRKESFELAYRKAN
jgi:Lipocalin-like domain